MAQANINLRSITPAFRGVQSALSERARIAANSPPSGLGTATAISGAVKDIAVEERNRKAQTDLLRFRAELEKDAEERRQKFDSRHEVTIRTDKDIEEIADAFGLDFDDVSSLKGSSFKDKASAEKFINDKVVAALGLKKTKLEQREPGAVEAPTPSPIKGIAGNTRIPVAQPSPALTPEGDITGTQAGLPTNEKRLANLESRIEILDPTQPAAAAKAERSTAKLFESLSPSDRALAESDPEKAIELLQKARFAPKEPKEKKIKALPSFANKKLNELGGLSRLAQRAIDTFDASFVGPIEGPLGQGLQKSKFFASKERATFLQGVAGLRNATIKAISGGAVTPSEAERLVQQLPDINSSEVDFEEKLKNYSEELNSIIQDNVASFKASGFSGVDELTPGRIVSRQERLQQAQQREIQGQENQIRNIAITALTTWNTNNPDKKIAINEKNINASVNRIKARATNAQR